MSVKTAGFPLSLETILAGAGCAGVHEQVIELAKALQAPIVHLANAMPRAIRVQAARPARQVVTLSGDGGVAMLFGDELIDLARTNLTRRLFS